MSSADGHPDAVTNTEERHALGLSHSEAHCLVCQRDGDARMINAMAAEAVKSRERIPELEAQAVVDRAATKTRLAELERERDELKAELMGAAAAKSYNLFTDDALAARLASERRAALADVRRRLDAAFAKWDAFGGPHAAAEKCSERADLSCICGLLDVEEIITDLRATEPRATEAKPGEHATTGADLLGAIDSMPDSVRRAGAEAMGIAASIRDPAPPCATCGDSGMMTDTRACPDCAKGPR